MIRHNRKRLWVLGVAGLFLALYALFGFLVAPKLLRSALIDKGETVLGVEPTIGYVGVNPFLFQLELKDCALADHAGTKMVGFQRLFVDFELASLWHRAYVFRTVELLAPFVNAAVSPSGALNLRSLQSNPPAPVNQASDQPLPRIQIKSFRVAKGSLSYIDAGRHTPFTSLIQPINFDLEDFTTGPEGGHFAFAGMSKLGERIEWRGNASVQPLASNGEFRIQGLRARTVWNYFKDRLNFVVSSGLIDISGRYHFALRDPVDFQLDISRLASQDLGIRPTATADDWISLPRLSVDTASLDLAQRRIKVATVALGGLRVLARRSADGQINLIELAQSPEDQIAASKAADESGAWQFELGEFSVADANIAVDDQSVRAAAPIAFSPANLRVTGASSDLGHPVAVAFDTGVNNAGAIGLTGQVTPGAGAASLHLQVKDLDLKVFQPYIAQQAALTLQRGRLQVSGDFSVGPGKQSTAPSSLKFAGNVIVNDLRTIDNELHMDFINWRRLELQNLKFQSEPGRLSIQRVSFREPYARVIIEPDKTLNIGRVLAARPTSTPVAAKAKPPQPIVAGPATESMAVAIREVLFEQGGAAFADLSIQPNFSAGIQALDGSVSGLSSDPMSRAQVKLRGEVNSFSPVTIDGEVNLFSAALYTDIALSFKNIELTTFNPYSGRFAGYNIAKGKLTTDLHYRVTGRKLDAQHHVTIDQLEFGAKTDSKEAVSLPIKLAVALLKDREGVIDLDLPVTGSLDDPHFRLGPIIWKVLVNLLVKVVTAPFALLGALFGGGPDIQFIDFQPGAATVDAAASGKITAVAKALRERPQLTIEVPISVVPELDREAIVTARFQSEAVAAMQSLKLAKPAVPGVEPPALSALDAPEQLRILAAMYKQRIGVPAKYPEISKDEPDDAVLRMKQEFLRTALREAITVSDAELRALAQQRAEAIQNGLLADGQVDPARVFLVVNDKAKVEGAQIRLELSLQ